MKTFLFSILLLLSGLAHAQLEIDETLTPAELVEDILVDPSVVPFNITFNGGSASVLSLQASRFWTNFNPTNLGLDQGVILATGRTIVAKGPNNLSNADLGAPDAACCDTDLQILSGSTWVATAAILEFDFVATGEELNFDFVFGSEEYPEYVGDSYNDSFGFFLSGPGLSGPYSNDAVNIALIPGTTTGVSINTVNNGNSNNGPCNNCDYYVNNGTGGTPAINADIQYDGFTTVLKAISPLICGETYHIKLAIANIGDGGYDSAVFLKNFTIAPLVLVDDLNLPENTSVCFGQTVTIHSGLTPGTNLLEWKKDGITLPDTTPSISVTEGGNYSLTVSTSAGCQLAYDEILIGYLPEIPVEQPENLALCSPTAAPFVFSTINQTDAILNGLDPDEYLITYYDSSYQDALDGVAAGSLTGAELDNYTLSGTSATIWVRIQENFLGSSDCFTVRAFTLHASQAPSGTISYPASPFCSAVATAQAPEATITGGGAYSASPAGLSIDSATGTVNPSLSTVGAYTVSYTIPATDSCPEFSASATVVINPAPGAPGVTSPVTYCQDAVAAPLTATGANLLWYTSPTGGSGSATAPVPDTATPGSTSYYVSQSNTGCESQRALIAVTIIAVPQPPIAPTPLGYCQGDPSGPLTATGANLLWYTAPSGGTGAAAAPTPDTSAAGVFYYYVSQSANGCESPRFVIEVNISAPPPAPTVISPVFYCRDDNAQPLTATGTNLLWYASATGGAGASAPPVPDTSTVGSTIYYVSQSSSGCEGPRAAITVNVTDTPTAPTVISPLEYCQGESADALTASGISLLWYTAPGSGAGTATAPVPDTDTAGTFYYYVSQSSGSCESERSRITVTVHPLPDAVLPSSGTICIDSETGLLLSPFTLDTGLSAATYDFEWFSVNGSAYTLLAGAVQASYTATLPGAYGVRVTNTATGCASEIVTSWVTAASPPLDIQISTSGYFSNPQSIVIEVIPQGLYEYQIDDGPFQPGNSFSGIAPGYHTVRVRNDCGELEGEALLIDYPKFFTPNGDGFNDTWNIRGLYEQRDSYINIFDRYGKLITSVRPSGVGWDGTYNGERLPATDYWFVVRYKENNADKEFKAHFSLIR